MKILQLSHYFYPHTGGVEKHVLEISREFAKNGHKVTIICSSENGPKEEILEHIRIKRFKYPKVKFLGLFYIWKSMFRYFKEFKEADIIHIHDVFLWYLPIKVIFPFKKQYITFHGWEGIYPIPLKNILLRRMASNLSKGSISVGKYLDKYYKTKSDFYVYGATEKVKPSFKKGNKRIVFVGRLSHDTGADVILKASFPETREIIFCGDGPLAGKLKNKGKVLGFVDPKKYIKDSGLTIAGGYLTTIEALSYGNFVLVICPTEIRKDIFALTPFKNFIQMVDNEKSLEKIIRGYFNNPSMYKKQIKEGAFWASNQTWENLAEIYLKLWRI